MIGNALELYIIHVKFGRSMDDYLSRSPEAEQGLRFRVFGLGPFGSGFRAFGLVSRAFGLVLGFRAFGSKPFG